MLEWNQIFIDTLIATNTANSSSQRLGAIVHTAIFDAYNGVERRYTPIFVQLQRLPGASRRAAVIAAAYTALVSLFPTRQAALDASYAASLAALSDDGGDGGQSRERGIAWGMEVAPPFLAGASRRVQCELPAFVGGPAVGQWRPTPPAFGPMSAQGLAFTFPFVLADSTQFQPDPPRTLLQRHVHGGFQHRQGARPQNRILAHRRANSACAVLGGQRQRPLESGSKPDCACEQSVDVQQQSSSRGPEHRHGRHCVHGLDREATLRCLSTEVTWRPVTAIPLAGTDGNAETAPDPDWLPLVTTPSHPEYPAGHPL